MPSDVVLPYRNLGLSIDIAVDVPSCPDVVVEFPVVRASHLEPRGAFEVFFDCSVPKAEWGRLERAALPELRLCEFSIASRRRRIHEPVSAGADGEASFRVTIDSSTDRGSVEFTAVVVRTVGSLDIADSAGQLLGWGETVTVVLDEHAPPPGNGLPIRWMSFERLNPPTANIFQLDAVGDVPTILLNSDIDGLRDVLHSTASTGRKARIRDAVFSQIALQVWTSLLVDCLDDVEALRSENPDHTLLDLVESVVPWKQGVISEWFPHLLGLRAIDDPLEDENFNGVVVERIGRIVQQKLGTPKLGFEGLFREFGLVTSGDNL